MANIGNNPNWTFYRHDGPIEADVMPRLVAEFPGFRPRWEKHLAFWEGEPAGNYNDTTQFVYFVVGDLYPNGKIEEVQHAFDLNLASRQAFAKEAFVPFLGPKSREAWDELERFWGGKSNVR
jgi:hypothetical protein